MHIFEKSFAIDDISNSISFSKQEKFRRSLTPLYSLIRFPYWQF